MKKAKLSTIIIALSLVALVSVSGVTAGAQLGVWRDINPSAYISPPANPQLNSLYMFSTQEGWAVGDSRPTTDLTNGLPAIFHYDGSTWNLVPAPRYPDLSTGPTPSAYNLTSVTFGPPNNPISKNDGWAVGFNGIEGVVSPGPPPVPTALALHWDGVTWRTQIAGFIGPDAGPLFSAFMVSSTDVWAVGQDQAGDAGVFWHWTGIPGLGGGWNLPQAHVSCPGVTAPNCGLFSIFMISPTEGWAVGAGGLIYHYFGGSWSSFTSPVTTALRSIFMLSPTEGWASGDGGVIIHYSSGTWSGPVSPGTTSSKLFSIFMVSSTEGWAFGAMGTILHYSGGSWSALPSNLVPTAPVTLLNFNSAYFNTPTDGWVVGTDGVVLHFDGVVYGTVTSPTINNFTSISFGPPNTQVNPNDGWAVGNSSSTVNMEPTIYHWNGFVWTKGVSIGTTNNLYSVFMLNSGDVWAVGGGPHPSASCSYTLCPTILHFTGGSWNSITPPSGSYSLKSIFMVNSGEGWAVGEQVGTLGPTGIILHWQVSNNVGTWGIFPAPSSPAPLPPLNSIFMLNANEGWAVGDDGAILHYTVSGGVGTWNLVTVSGTPGLFQNANLTSIYMLSPTSGWAVGGCWFSLQTANSNQCPLTSPAGPIIIYWDGTKWEPVAAPSIPGGITGLGHTTAILKSVFLTNPNDGWAVGFPGISAATVLHWDGISWNFITLSPPLVGEVPPILTSAYMTSSVNGWIVGGSPDFSSTSVPGVIYFGQACGSAPLPCYGYKTPLSTMLRFSAFGGVLTATSTVTVVSTVSTSTTAVTAITGTSSVPAGVQVSIKLTDNQGNPVSGVNANIPSVSGAQGVTNQQGIVTFTLPPGTYTVNLSKGANSETLTINVTSNGQTFTTTAPGSSGGTPGIPGFPVESIIAGIIGGVFALMLLRRRRHLR